jgi:uncharacterized protein YoxC
MVSSDDDEAELESQYLDTKAKKPVKQKKQHESTSGGSYSLEEINSSLLEELEEKENEIDDLRKQVEELSSSLSGIGGDVDDNSKEAKIIALAKKVSNNGEF